MLSLSPSYTQRAYNWTNWKKIQNLKSLIMQVDEDDRSYTIYGYDGPEVHICTIWKAEVPSSITFVDYTQDQNDLDKADFEANWKSGGNLPVNPRTRDGKAVVLPNLFPGNVFLYITGVGDDSTTIGAGSKFKLQSANGTQELEFQFRDWIYLAGGGIFYESATTDDEITMKLYAPPSTVSASAGGNTGNCNLQPIGPGKNMILPAAGNGTHNLTYAVPLPSYDEENQEAPDGYWEWSNPDTGLGVTTANFLGTGKYNLFDFAMDITYFVRNLQLVGSSASGNFNITIPAIKPKKVLPHWKFKTSLINGGILHTVKVGWYLVTARRKTV